MMVSIDWMIIYNTLIIHIDGKIFNDSSRKVINDITTLLHIYKIHIIVHSLEINEKHSYL